jgi:hypothetical protein
MFAKAFSKDAKPNPVISTDSEQTKQITFGIRQRLAVLIVELLELFYMRRELRAKASSLFNPKLKDLENSA